jgi:riboflavin synthase
MFTGLIQHIGTVCGIAPNAEGGARLQVDIGLLMSGSLTGDSVAVDGCCLTIVEIAGTVATFDAVPETLRRTTLGTLKASAQVNLECAMLPSTRLGGHFVQGHVDGLASVQRIVEGGRWAEWHLQLEDKSLAEQIVEKGSIALDGISLTVAGCDAQAGTFWVALIPETLTRTTIVGKRQGARINIETDILGKYVLAALKNRLSNNRPLNEQDLRANGY